MPFRRTFSKQRNASVVRAVAARFAVEEVRIAVIAGDFGEQAADIVPRPVSQDQGRPLLDDRKVPAVAGYEQIRRRSE
jgi:hypothetical protein